MSEHIQPLLERIRSEGLKQAEAERDSLLTQTRAEADKLLAAAKDQAAEIRSQAEKDAADTVARGQVSLQQAARDLLLRLRGEIARQLDAAARAAAAAPLSSAELVTKLLHELIQARSNTGRVTVEAGSDLAATLKDLLPALLKDAGSADGEIVMNPRMGKGFELRFEGSSASIDLTDAAVAEWLTAQLRPDLATLLKPAGT